MTARPSPRTWSSSRWAGTAALRRSSVAVASHAMAIGIREVGPDDAPWFARGMRDPHVIAHSGMARPLSEDELRAVLPRDGIHEWAILDGDEPVGLVILFGLVLHEQRCEVGFWLLPEGRG